MLWSNKRAHCVWGTENHSKSTGVPKMGSKKINCYPVQIFFANFSKKLFFRHKKSSTNWTFCSFFNFYVRGHSMTMCTRRGDRWSIKCLFLSTFRVEIVHVEVGGGQKRAKLCPRSHWMPPNSKYLCSVLDIIYSRNHLVYFVDSRIWSFKDRTC